MIIDSIRRPIALPRIEMIPQFDGSLMFNNFDIINDEKRKIGWIGTGETSNALVYQLIRYGYDVTVFDLD